MLHKRAIKKLTFTEFQAQVAQLRSCGQDEDANKLIEIYWNYKQDRHSMIFAIRNVAAGVLLLNVITLLMKVRSLPKDELISWAIPIGITSLVCLFGLAVPMIFPKRQNEADEVEPYYRDMVRRNVFKSISDALKEGDK